MFEIFDDVGVVSIVVVYVDFVDFVNVDVKGWEELVVLFDDVLCCDVSDGGECVVFVVVSCEVVVDNFLIFVVVKGFFFCGFGRFVVVVFVGV